MALTISGKVVACGAKTRVVRFLVGIGEAATKEHRVRAHHLPTDAAWGQPPSRRAWDRGDPPSSRGAANPGQQARTFPLVLLPPACEPHQESLSRLVRGLATAST